MSGQIDVFKEEIFIEKIDLEDIWLDNFGQLKKAFEDDLKKYKKLTNLEN